MKVMNLTLWSTGDAGAGNDNDGGGDKLPGRPYPGPHQPPMPDGGPGVPNPPRAGCR